MTEIYRVFLSSGLVTAYQKQRHFSPHWVRPQSPPHLTVSHYRWEEALDLAITWNWDLNLSLLVTKPVIWECDHIPEEQISQW